MRPVSAWVLPQVPVWSVESEQNSEDGLRLAPLWSGNCVMDSWSNQHFPREDKFRRPINSRRWAIESMPLHRVCRTHERTRAGVGSTTRPVSLVGFCEPFTHCRDQSSSVEEKGITSPKGPTRPSRRFSCPRQLLLTAPRGTPSRSLPTILPSLLNAQSKIRIAIYNIPGWTPEKGNHVWKGFSRLCCVRFRG